MPIYAYRCSTCGYAKDQLQKMSDPVLTVCPACGASTYQKQVTAAGFQLKGSGWYVTDFRGGANGAAKKDGEAAVPAAGNDAAKPAGDAAPPSGKEAPTSPASKGDAPAAAPAASAPPPAPAAGSK